MAEETTTSAKHLTLGAFQAGIKKAFQSVKGFFIDASGFIKTSLLPLGSGLKVDEDGKVAVDTASLNIEIPEAITEEEAVTAVDEAYTEVFTTPDQGE